MNIFSLNFKNAVTILIVTIGAYLAIKYSFYLNAIQEIDYLKQAAPIWVEPDHLRQILTIIADTHPRCFFGSPNYPIGNFWQHTYQQECTQFLTIVPSDCPVLDNSYAPVYAIHDTPEMHLRCLQDVEDRKQLYLNWSTFQRVRPTPDKHIEACK